MHTGELNYMLSIMFFWGGRNTLYKLKDLFFLPYFTCYILLPRIQNLSSKHAKPTEIIIH